MAKSKIMVRITLLVILILFMLSSCQSEINQDYYRYYIGIKKIENPVLVVFKGNEQSYVCPDSALKYCCDSNWNQRKDVYPYLPVAENTQQHPTLFHRGQISSFLYFNYYYFPYYEFNELLNGNIFLYKFHYDIEKFEVYMQAIDGYWYDIADPYFQNPYADSYDYFSYGKEYRLVVKPHYNLFQILKLQYKYKDHFRVP